MAGVLSFALGLETSAFAAGLDRAGGRLLAFLSIGKVVTETIEGVMGAIERGGALTDLSARTGAAVGDLYELQEAFAVVGISADAVPAMINRFNKSLSGVGEMGENTTEAFSALGLSVEDLKKLDAPKQIEAVAQQLATMQRSDALDVASRLFGRGGADYIMQISGDLQGFRETLAASSREAAIFARNAAAFDKLGDTVTRIKGTMQGMFAGIAQGVAPQLQRVADMLVGLDLPGFGERIGLAISDAFTAIDLGKFEELWTLTLKAGAQDAANFLGKAVADVYAHARNGSGASLAESAGKIAKTLLLPTFRAIGGPWEAGANIAGFVDFSKTFGLPIMRGALGLQNEYAEELGRMRQDLASERAKRADVEKSLPHLDFGFRVPANLPSEKVLKPDVTALEKIGLIFDNGSANDAAKQTARYSQSSSESLRRIERLLQKPAPALVNQ